LSYRSHVRSKRVVAQAVTSPARSPIALEVPTLVELGVRGVEAPSWYSVVAPAACPTEVIGRLHAEIVTIAARPDYREPLERQALEPTTTTPQQFAALLRAEYDKWGRVIKALKLHIMRWGSGCNVLVG
jgi:tripartite-type tricarboxylate transporter receptor subunit TctC